MKHFFKITSSGGYIDCFAWVNTGAHKDIRWGEVINVFGLNLSSSWAGDITVVRAFTKL